MKAAIVSAFFFVAVPDAFAACAPVGADWTSQALARALAPPPGLPRPDFDAGEAPTAEKIALGRKLFFDRRLSINKTMSCAMCHVPEQAFTNNELRTSVGVEGRSNRRNAPTIVNAAFLGVLFHDGRDNALETQFIGPLLARAEMANPSAGHVVALLNGLPEYRLLFEEAFGAAASLDRIGAALGAYQRTVVAANSPFDRAHFGGEAGAMGEDAKRGLELFAGKAGCSSCHAIEGGAALFTDQAFHDTGYLWMREGDRKKRTGSIRIEMAEGVAYDVPMDRIAAVGAPPAGDLGRYEVTEDPADLWKIRTPPLRNVAVTQPYMHDGGLATLAEVIDFYDGGGRPHAGQDPLIRPLGLTNSDKADIEAFLESLTSPDLQCLAKEARVAAPDNE